MAAEGTHPFEKNAKDFKLAEEQGKPDSLRKYITKRNLKSDKAWDDRRRRRELDSKPNVKATEDALLKIYDSLDPGVVKKTVALLSKPVIVRAEVGDHVAQIGDIAWALTQLVLASGIRIGGPIGRYAYDADGKRILQFIGGIQLREKFNSRHVLYGMIRPFGIVRWVDTLFLKLLTDIVSKSKTVHDIAQRVDESTIGKRVEHVLDRFAEGGLFRKRNIKPEDIPSMSTAEKPSLGDNQVFEATAKPT